MPRETEKADSKHQYCDPLFLGFSIFEYFGESDLDVKSIVQQNERKFQALCRHCRPLNQKFAQIQIWVFMVNVSDAALEEYAKNDANMVL